MKVLVVDDKKFNLFAMGQKLRTASIDCCIDTAHTVEMAYQLYLLNSYDLVIIDGDLNSHITGPMFAQLVLNKNPRQSIAGWTACQTAKEQFSHVFKLALSLQACCMVWNKDIDAQQLSYQLFNLNAQEPRGLGFVQENF